MNKIKEKTFNEKLDDLRIEEIRRELKQWHNPFNKIKRKITKTIKGL